MKKAFHNPIGFTPLPVTIITSFVYAALIVTLLVTHLVVPPAPNSPTTVVGTNLTEAWQDLQTLSNGFHPYNSRRNDVVRDWLLIRIEAILEGNQVAYSLRNHHNHIGLVPHLHPTAFNSSPVVVFSDMTSNLSFSTDGIFSTSGRAKEPGTSTYFEGTNIIVYIRGSEDDKSDRWTRDGNSHRRGGVLVNAHYDSVSTGYGATDDGAGVVSILQLIKHFTSPGQKPKKGIVALLNNGEEDGLHGAFVFSQHPLSRFAHAFLNLEGAGAGGRATLFRSTDTEVTRFYQRSKFPFGTVISGDGFKRGFVRSQTDYVVLNGLLGLRGLDVAFMEPRARYHTDQDDTRHTSRDSLWHMLSAALSTMQGLTSDTSSTFEGNSPGKGKVPSGKGTDGVWFDIFGQVLAVFRLRTLFALSVTLLAAAPIILIVIGAILVRVDKLYLFSSSKHHHHAEGDDKVQLQGWRGFFRYPIIFFIASAANVGLAFLVTKVNPYIVYSSQYAVWSMMLSAWLFLAWFLSRAADFVRPTAFQRTYAHFWMFAGGWLVLVAVAVLEDRFKIASGYFMVFYFAAIFISTLIAFLELFGLSRKLDYANAVEDHGERTQTSPRSNSMSSGRLLAPPTDEQLPESVEGDGDPQDEATEATSLLRNDRQTTFAHYTTPHQAVDDDAVEDDLSEQKQNRVFGDEQPWSWSLPTWTWLLQFLLVAPIVIVLSGQIGLLLTSAMYQTLSDGSSVLTVYMTIAIFAILVLTPLGPFLHRYTFHIPTFLLLVFAGTLVYNLVAFPFSPTNRLKLYFIQTVDLDTGINEVSLTGIGNPYLMEAINSLPSSAGRQINCASSSTGKADLAKCAWEGLPPRVVSNTHPEVPPRYGYSDWLSFNVSRNASKNEASFHLSGRNTRACKIIFNNPISDFTVDGAGEDSRLKRVSEEGSKEIRLWSRTWEKPWDVKVRWPVSEGKQAGEEGLDGRVVCLWSDDNETGLIPALDEMRRFAPEWVAITKGDAGLVEGKPRQTTACLEPPHNLIKVASSTFSEVITAFGSYIEHYNQYLPSALRNFLAQAATSIQKTADHLPQPILDTFNSLQAKTSADLLYPTLLLTFVFLLSMSGWTRRFWPSGGRSPFGAAAGATPTVTDDDFSYMGPGDIVDPPLRSRGTMSHDAYGFPPTRNSTRADSESLSPDILTIKHKGTTYPLHFPAFTISDGALKIGDLRRLAAEQTRADDPRRVKLLYKGRVLKDDLRACRDEGLKQNSELMCIVSEAPIVNGYAGAGDESSSSADEDEILAAEGLGGLRVDVDGTIIDDGRPRRRKGHRGGKKKKGGSGVNSPRDSSHHLAPGAGPGASPSRSSSPMPPLQQQPQQQRPKSAMEKLDELASTFRTKFVPLCVQFTVHPPSDGRAKDLEYKKLSESILAQIILKLDAVETEGDEAARAKRKALVKETQDMLNELDRVGKRGP